MKCVPPPSLRASVAASIGLALSLRCPRAARMRPCQPMCAAPPGRTQCAAACGAAAMSCRAGVSHPLEIHRSPIPRFGTQRGSERLYCGQKRRIPGTDGRCGPNNGPNVTPLAYRRAPRARRPLARSAIPKLCPARAVRGVQGFRVARRAGHAGAPRRRRRSRRRPRGAPTPRAPLWQLRPCVRARAACTAWRARGALADPPVAARPTAQLLTDMEVLSLAMLGGTGSSAKVYPPALEPHNRVCAFA